MHLLYLNIQANQIMAETIVAWLQTKPKSKNQYILYGCVKNMLLLWIYVWFLFTLCGFIHYIKAVGRE